MRDRAASLAAKAGVTIEHIAKSHIRKESVVSRVLERRGDHPGLVPIGTYTGWNLFRDDWFANGFCPLSGSFIPFAATKAERERTGDPRPSLEERYPTKKVYVAAVRKAAH